MYPPKRRPPNKNFVRNRPGIIRTDTYCSLCDLPPPHSHRLTNWPRPSGSSSGEQIVPRHFIIATFSKLQDYDMTNVTLLIIPSMTCRPSTLRRPKSSRCADPRQTKTRYVPRPPSPLSTLSLPPTFSSQSSASINWTTRSRFSLLHVAVKTIVVKRKARLYVDSASQIASQQHGKPKFTNAEDIAQ